MDVLGYPVFIETLDQIQIDFDKKTLINTINPHSYIVSKKDKLFREALLNSDILLPDGVGIVYAAKWLKKAAIKKIAGADIHEYLLKRANQQNFSVFYLGANLKTLDLIAKKIANDFPNVEVKYFSPPYKKVFSEEDSIKMINAVNQFKPDILFIGMTAPKQEKWAYLYKEALNAKVIVSIGAVFDFYAGTVKRPGQFWINAGLEWLPRFFNEPKRLWKRNVISTPLFILDILKYKFSQ